MENDTKVEQKVFKTDSASLQESAVNEINRACKRLEKNVNRILKTGRI